MFHPIMNKLIYLLNKKKYYDEFKKKFNYLIILLSAQVQLIFTETYPGKIPNIHVINTSNTAVAVICW